MASNANMDVTQEMMDVAELLLKLTPTKRPKSAERPVGAKPRKPTMPLTRQGPTLSTEIVRMRSAKRKNTVPPINQWGLVGELERPAKRGRVLVDLEPPVLLRKGGVKKLPDGSFVFESSMVARQRLTPQQIRAVLAEEAETKQGVDTEFINAARAAHHAAKVWEKKHMKAANTTRKAIITYTRDNLEEIRNVRQYAKARRKASDKNTALPAIAASSAKKVQSLRKSVDFMFLLNANIGAMASMGLTTQKVVRKLRQEARSHKAQTVSQQRASVRAAPKPHTDISTSAKDDYKEALQVASDTDSSHE